MKKILLLLAASLVLFTGCKKEDTDLMENVVPSVTQEYTCPNCGAKYSVTYKRGTTYSSVSGQDWKLNPPEGIWTVKDESGQNVSHYEYYNYTKMYFICTCGEKSKEFKK